MNRGSFKVSSRNNIQSNLWLKKLKYRYIHHPSIITFYSLNTFIELYQLIFNITTNIYIYVVSVLVAVNINMGSEECPSTHLEGQSSLLQPLTPRYDNNIAQDTSINAFYCWSILLMDIIWHHLQGGCAQYLDMKQAYWLFFFFGCFLRCFGMHFKYRVVSKTVTGSYPRI